MRKIIFLMLLMMFAVFAYAKTDIPSMWHNENEKAPLLALAGPKRISAESLAKMLELEQSMVVIDAREEERFRQQHIRNAINVPIEVISPVTISKLIPEKDTPAVIYCEEAQCPKVLKAIRSVVSSGYSNIHYYQDGVDAWALRGMATIEKRERNS